jgi:hypothetical protein
MSKKVRPVKGPKPNSKLKGRGQGKQTKAIHLRYNGWKLGDYDAFNLNGEIVVGQLASISMQSGMGLFRGFVIGDQNAGSNTEGHEREWQHELSLANRGNIHPAWVNKYERIVVALYGNS